MPCAIAGVIEVDTEVGGGVSLNEICIGEFERTLHPEMMKISEQRKMILIGVVGEVRLYFMV